MSNTTITNSAFSNDYLTVALAVLFVASEALPFIKKHKGNGLCDTIRCLLTGSKCMIDKTLEVIEKVEPMVETTDIESGKLDIN
tara:strand:- start:13007 stop:13258 length:252 start_codon:yes stop_codon:yes gene_type:complete